MSLYTKYRPRDWDSVIGQDAISSVLRTSLIQDRVGHAYILTGSRGTGKTTTARIIAKGVNCLDLQNGNPCHKCAHCVAFDEGNMLDCIEIDGASNNGVENVRDLIEKARFEPNQGKYKIYIIDEVHMLSTGAFNALLKTLEEPPSHVKFILATTEIDKVPETIRSRSLRFDFKKIGITDIINRLKFVCEQEGIKAETGALEIIARAARGALRDALTLTEQNTVNGEISIEYVKSTLSLIEDSLISEIIDIIRSSDIDKMTHIIETLRTRHAEVRGLFDQILYMLRDSMLLAFSSKNNELFREYSDISQVFESAYSKIKSIPDGGLLIELTLMRATARKSMIQIDSKNDDRNKMGVRGEGTVGTMMKVEKLKSVARTEGVGLSPDAFGTFDNKSTEESISEKNIKTKEMPIGGQGKTKIEDPETSSGGQKSVEGQEKKTESTSSPFSYIRLLEEVKKIKSTLVLDLKTARFELSDKSLTLIFNKEWHYNRTNTPTMKSTIIEALETLYGAGWTVSCKLDTGGAANIADDVF